MRVLSERYLQCLQGVLGCRMSGLGFKAVEGSVQPTFASEFECCLKPGSWKWKGFISQASRSLTSGWWTCSVPER